MKNLRFLRKPLWAWSVFIPVEITSALQRYYIELKGILTLFRMGGAKSPPHPTSFSSVTPTNVGISSKTFWLLDLALLEHWRKISNLYLVPVPNYWTSTKTTSQKKRFFWSNPFKIEVVISSIIEMLELPNFGHMNKSIIQFESRNEILLVTSSTEIMTS